VVICPTAVEPEDPRSYYSVARRLSEEIPGAVLANQYYNPSNPDAHYRSTAPEVWEQTNGEIDVFCAGMGTGGTLSGCGKYFKEKKPGFRVVGVDPIGSLYYDYVKSGRLTRPFSYKVEGIGEDFLPGTMNLKILDEVVRVDDKECFMMTRALTRDEGIFAGGSSGAAVAGAIKYARHTGRKEKILVLLPDSASKYLSKIFNDDWMRENGFLDEDDPLGVVADLVKNKAQREVITALENEPVRKVIDRMKEHDISQLPIMNGQGICAGIVAEVDLLKYTLEGKNLAAPVGALATGDYATVTPNTKVSLLSGIFTEAKMLVVLDGEQIVGVLTKIDLIDALARRRPAS
jgi:cystathionine beta-synthase